MLNEQKRERQKLQKHTSEKAQHMPGTSLKTDKVSAGSNKAALTGTAAASTGANVLSVNGIRLDAQAARNAIIMSEIIGPPKAKRRRGRCY